MSFSRSIADIANTPTISESSLLVNQGEWQHHHFGDKSRDSDSFLRKKSHNRGLSQVDKAYRKLGQQLSLRAHGSFVVRKNRTCCTLGREGSSFTPYNRSLKRTSRTDVLPVGLNHMPIEARTRCESHEHYQKIQFRKRNVLRHFSMNASKLFRMFQDDVIAESKTIRPANSYHEHSTTTSPQRKNILQQEMRNDPTPGEWSNKDIPPLPQGEQMASQDTSHSPKTPWDSHQINNLQTSTSGSQDSRGKLSYNEKRLGECLTDPSLSSSNSGFDNVNGDLIVYENDVITIPRNKIHVLTKERMRDVTHVDFSVQRRLGQGTFAQVFQCRDLQTGKLVALKIVKNKAAYARQASIEIDVLRALRTKVGNDANNKAVQDSTVERSSSQNHRGMVPERDKHDYMVDLVCYFLYKSHLCLVFELLGQNLYDVLKQRSFRGLRLSVVRSVIRQALHGIAELAKHGVVHCDIKPENVLLVNNDEATEVGSAKSSDDFLLVSSVPSQAEVGVKQTVEYPISQNSGTNAHIRIKLIDFGSACFEGQSMQSYIQSRFYRSPEVLIGLPFDSGIDIWSLGCVAAELFLGLPILPGVHEHDQLSRILEMISTLPDWMLDQGSKASKFFTSRAPSFEKTVDEELHPTLQNQKWRLKSQAEFISSLSEEEIRRKGGLLKLEKQRHSRYFKKRRLSEIVFHKGQSGTKSEDQYDLDAFVHFLYGLLDPDPRRRWTAVQASQHPFLTGSRIQEHTERTFLKCRESGNLANLIGNLYWEPPLIDDANGFAYTTNNQFLGQNAGSLPGWTQTSHNLSEQIRSNGIFEGSYDTRYQRTSHSDLSQNLDRHPLLDLKNDKTYLHQDRNAVAALSENGFTHHLIASNGHARPTIAGLQQTEMARPAQQMSFRGDKRDDSRILDLSSGIGGVNTTFPAPINSQYNQYR